MIMGKPKAWNCKQCLMITTRLSDTLWWMCHILVCHWDFEEEAHCYNRIRLKRTTKPQTHTHSLSLASSRSVSLSNTHTHTHTPSITGCDEGSRPSNKSKCPFPWQLQILDGQNKEIHHCCCNNWLFLPDYSWPKMAPITPSCPGKWHTATDMGIHLHTHIKEVQ